MTENTSKPGERGDEPQKSELVSISDQVAYFCTALINIDGNRACPGELLEQFLVCIEHQVTRPGSWEASIGREFLESHGYVVVHGWRGGL